jgi:N-acetylglucosaminyldiphosphoundecaprenol N-acetyl-beta-D-mannosaminyltransferase
LSPDQEEELKAKFHKLKPDMTWIGLSTPKQERFMAEYLPKLDTTVMCGVGAAFDFHSKVVKQAPRWIQRSGFEWLYRTIQEPRRLLVRYLRNNTRFLWRYAGRAHSYSPASLFVLEVDLSADGDNASPSIASRRRALPAAAMSPGMAK